MKKFIFGFFILFICLFVNENVIAQDECIIESVMPKLIRVGISDNNFSTYVFDKISLTADTDFVASDGVSFESLFQAGEAINIEFKNDIFYVKKNSDTIFKTKNKLSIFSVDGSPVAIVGLKRKSRQALYYGNIELVKSLKSSNKFSIVNVLQLQTYLKGVVPNEMPTAFGLEALKAQAILARNYALKPRENYYKEFDICDSVACQVYFGANTHEKLSDKAVDETNNIVTLYKGDLILAVYSSTAGGYTESYKDVFMQNLSKGVMAQNIPYLVAVPDDEKTLDLSDETKMREFYSSSPDTYDNDSPYFRWVKVWNLNDLNKILTQTVAKASQTGFVKTKYPVDYAKSDYFGNLKSIFVNKRGKSGKIVALTLITNKNEFTIYKELIIRRVFMHENKMLPSANVFFDFKKIDGQHNVIATGGGLGHGVGMSQWGAGKMSKAGSNYTEIIKHYYKDVDIATEPVNVSTNKPVSFEFYTKNKNAKLKIANKFHFSDLNIIINHRCISESDMKKLQSDKVLDISNYLAKGKNLVAYKVKNSDKNNTYRLWIELETK